MPLILELTMDRDAFMIGELAAPMLSIANIGEDDEPSPELDGRGHIGIRLTMDTPDGRLAFTLPDDSGYPSECSGETDLAAGRVLTRYLTLPSSEQPGGYTLSARMVWGSRAVQSSTVQWYRESERPVQPVVPTYRGLRDPSQRTYFFYRGEKLSALYAAPLVYDDANAADVLRVGTPEHLLDVPRDANGLRAIALDGRAVNRNEEWVAWLAGGSVHAAIQFYGCQHLSCTLPFAAARIAGAVSSPDGLGMDVLAMSVDRAELALVRFPRPSLPPMPFGTETSDTSSPEEVGDDLEIGEDEGDEDDDPLFPVQTAEPLIVWTYRLDAPALACAFVRGAGVLADKSAIAVLSADENCIAITYFAMTGDSAPDNFSAIRADGAVPPDPSIALALDGRGRGHVALLLLSKTEGDGAQCTVARTSFDEAGAPRLSNTTAYHEVAELPSDPLGTAIAFFINDEGGHWSIDWSVVLEGNRCLASSRVRAAQLMTTNHTLCMPPSQISFGERSFILASTAGRSVFIDCA